MASACETEVIKETAENKEKIFDFSVSDFARLVKTSLFIDKTLMIKDIFSESSRILITAPRQFGKSTNIDMINRFLEIEVDYTTDTPKPVNTTENYKLFKDNKLDICNDEEFFNEHFGKHPVIRIDCGPLGEVSSSVSTMKMFTTIVLGSFKQHIYLLRSSKFPFLQSNFSGVPAGIFRTPQQGSSQNYNKNTFIEDYNFDENIYKKYFYEKDIISLSDSDLMHSFKRLSKILYSYFEKKVFVLIDNYDAFINSMFLLKGDHPDRDRIISFVDTMINSLLMNNPCVERALLTGILPVAGDKFIFNRNNVDCYSFMDGNNFCKYYGLTCVKLDKFLKKLIIDDGERNKRKQMIDEYYGYITENKSFLIYNIWSVLQYLHRGELESYWCTNSSRCLRASNMKIVFKNSQIQSKVLSLLLGDSLCLKDILQPLSADDVLQVNNVITSGKDVPSSAVNIFFSLLYHFGYLSTSHVLGWGSVKVKIPNEEIKLELANIVLEANSTIFEFFDSHKAIDDVRSAMDLFHPDSTDKDHIFYIFCKIVAASWSRVLLTFDATHFLVHLFMILATRPEYNQTSVKRVISNGPLFIHLKNKHQVEILITAIKDTSDHPTADTLKKSAINSHKQMVDYIYKEHIFDESTDFPCIGLIVIAYGHYFYKSLQYFNVIIAYSYSFKECDTSTNVRFCTDTLKNVKFCTCA